MECHAVLLSSLPLYLSLPVSPPLSPRWPITDNCTASIVNFE